MADIDKEIMAKAFYIIGDGIKRGDCELSQEAYNNIFTQLQGALRVPMNKTEACKYLNISRSTFDARVAAGQLPKGKKTQGTTQKVWYKDELK